MKKMGNESWKQFYMIWRNQWEIWRKCVYLISMTRKWWVVEIYISCNVCIVCLVATGNEEEGSRNLHLYKLLPQKKKKTKKKKYRNTNKKRNYIIKKKYIYIKINNLGETRELREFCDYCFREFLYKFTTFFLCIIIIHKSILCLTF